ITLELRRVPLAHVALATHYLDCFLRDSSVPVSGCPDQWGNSTSSTTLTVVTPAGVGTVNVSVTTPGGTVTLPNAYTYAVAPTVASVVPNAGPDAGGQSVTVAGTGVVAGNTQVLFG
ncbi:hypothetical protein P2L57_39720, partial [Streptomyces ferralitis]|nr:hypothetical protein [Streptantibioticus ferralitis]